MLLWHLTCIVLLWSLSVSTKASYKRVLKIDWKRYDCCCFSFFSLIGIKTKRSKSSYHDFGSWIKSRKPTIKYWLILRFISKCQRPTLYIAKMSSRWTLLQIWFDPRDPVVELNGRGRVSRIYRCFHSHYRTKRKHPVLQNRLFYNTVHLKYFSTCNSHKL